MKELFFDLPITNTSLYIIKLISFPLFFLVLFYILYVIGIRLISKKPNAIYQNFISKSYFLRMVLSLIMMLVLNIYWFLVFYFVGYRKFKWDVFSFSLDNVYVQVLPFVLTFLILGLIYSNNRNSLKKI